MTLVRMPRASEIRLQTGKGFGISYLSVFPIVHTIGVHETVSPQMASLERDVGSHLCHLRPPGHELLQNR